MLVCNVSLRPTRTAIAAGLTEAGAASDATVAATVFAVLTDNPASAIDTITAYVGSIMVEAASASDAVTVAGGAVAALVDESATAAELVTVTSMYGVVLAEAATAADSPSGAIISAAAIFDGTIALDGPINPSATAPTVIYIEG